MHLKAAKDRVIVKVSMDYKNQYTFANGTTIRMERDRCDFDKKYTTISQGEVMDSEYIPTGATVYFHHNGSHENNRLYNYKLLNAQEIAEEIRYFSIPESECYLWRMGEGELQPLKGFETALRVFKPYRGILQGIESTLLKNVLYITSGHLKGQVCHTLKACDYQLTVLIDGRDKNIIRVRHSEDPNFEREELVAVNHAYTQAIWDGDLFVGISISDAMSIS